MTGRSHGQARRGPAVPQVLVGEFGGQGHNPRAALGPAPCLCPATGALALGWAGSVLYSHRGPRNPVLGSRGHSPSLCQVHGERGEAAAGSGRNSGVRRPWACGVGRAGSPSRLWCRWARWSHTEPPSAGSGGGRSESHGWSRAMWDKGTWGPLTQPPRQTSAAFRKGGALPRVGTNLPRSLAFSGSPGLQPTTRAALLPGGPSHLCRLWVTPLWGAASCPHPRSAPSRARGSTGRQAPAGPWWGALRPYKLP